MASRWAKLWHGTVISVSIAGVTGASVVSVVFAAGFLYVVWPQIGGRMGWSVHPDDVDLAHRVGLTDILMTPRTVFTNSSGVQLTVVCVETNGNRLAFTPADNSLRRLTPETGEAPGMCWDRRFTFSHPQTTVERLADILEAKWMPSGLLQR